MDGLNHSFTYKSDKVLRVYSTNRTNNGVDLGVPFVTEMDGKRRKIQEREDSTLHRVGFKRYRYVENTTTGVFYQLG